MRNGKKLDENVKIAPFTPPFADVYGQGNDGFSGPFSEEKNWRKETNHFVAAEKNGEREEPILTRFISNYWFLEKESIKKPWFYE